MNFIFVFQCETKIYAIICKRADFKPYIMGLIIMMRNTNYNRFEIYALLYVIREILRKEMQIRK